MKKFFTILITVCLSALLVQSAYAGGPPPKNVMKGVFIAVDMAAKTATIQVDGHDDLKVLNLHNAAESAHHFSYLAALFNM